VTDVIEVERTLESHSGVASSIVVSGLWVVEFSALSDCWSLADILKVEKREKKVGKVRKYSDGALIRILTVRQFGLGLATVRVYKSVES
jgi:hypothetical protein